MTRHRGVVAALATLFLLAAAPSAFAHAGNPNYRSVIDAVTPQVPGLKIQVLGYDSQFQITNRTGQTVTVDGYDGEPYVRLLADGTVEQNHLSPATYLNNSDFITEAAPSFTNPEASPQWKVVDKTGNFIWHDHRMHWMGAHLPPQVKDKHKKTKIFDYAIPLSVGTQKGKIAGTLFWVGSEGGFPVAAIVSLVALVAVALATVLLVQRRRRRASASTAPGPGSAEEAW